MKFLKIISITCSLLFLSPVIDSKEIFDDQIIDHHQSQFEDIAMKIWDLAEVGYQEYESSNLLIKSLKGHGFEITDGVAEIPTAFIAEYGSGYPTIAILGEYDALPGVSQSSSPFREKGESESAGHACGHHLFAAGSAWTAVAVKDWLVANNMNGTIRFYGTPAEEGGSGKVYMVRSGLFNDVDIVLHWHPGSVNHARPRTSNANKSVKFTYKGISAHAASDPEKGRSALDGVEALNMMTNLMREHIPQESRIHYVITNGGLAPNVIPELAEVYYYIRHPDKNTVQQLFNRVVKAAEGAAMGTETKVSYEVMHGNYSLMPNDTLQKIMHENLENRGGIKYTEEEVLYAKTIMKTFIDNYSEIGDQEEVLNYRKTHGYGSTDVGDVSWLIPTAGARIATWVPGTSAHSWQAVASGGMSIGLKGTKLAVEVLADTAKYIYQNPSVVEKSKRELEERTGDDFNYIPLLGDREPPLNYRDN